VTRKGGPVGPLFVAILIVIASEAKQSTLPHKERAKKEWIASSLRSSQ
jgi:hypothetical protein